MNSVINEIKSKLDIVSLILEYIQLKPAGTNFKALCPFHQEKTPSFFVSPERQIWHCFGCGAGGSIFDFVMKMEDIEFPEALRILAKKADVVLQREDPQVTSQRTKALDISQQAALYYHQILIKSPAGEIARQYLKERGVSLEIIKEFQLGYAPNSWDAVSKFLFQKGFKPAEIIASGLVVQKSDPNKLQANKLQPNYYDRFRNRLMFPLCDVHGNIVGFTGRILDCPSPNTQHPTPNPQAPISKYVNTPQTLIYNKSQILYGLDKAKQQIREKKLAVVVEGQMDVLASHQVGIKNVVASSGTALTLDQIKLIKRFTPNLALGFDIDPAGLEATKRGIEMAWQQDMEVKIIRMECLPKQSPVVLEQHGRSKGRPRDPDELIKKDPKLWQQAIENAQLIMEYYFDSTFKNRDLLKVEEKKAAAKILLPIIAKLKDKIEQDFWLKKLAGKLDVQEQSLRDSIRINAPVGQGSDNRGQGASQALKNRDLMLSERLVGLLLKFSEELKDIIKDLKPKILASPKLQEIADLCRSATQISTDLLFKKKPDLKNYLNSLILSIEKDFPDEPEPEEIQKEAKQIWQELQKNHLLRELKTGEKELKHAEENKKVDEVRVLSEKFERMTKKLGTLNS